MRIQGLGFRVEGLGFRRNGKEHGNYYNAYIWFRVQG